MLTIEMTAPETPRAVECHYEIAQTIVEESRVELIVVPTLMHTGKRIHSHQLECCPKRYQSITQIRHIGIGQINGTTRTAGIDNPAIKVDTRNHGSSFQFRGQNQLLRIARSRRDIRQIGCTVENHVRRVSHQDNTCARRLCRDLSRQQQRHSNQQKRYMCFHKHKF